MNNNDFLVERTVGGLHLALMEHTRQFFEPGGPVLDIGCGTGAFLNRLAQSGFSGLTGIDRDINQVGFSNAKILKIDLNKAEPWPLASTSFYLISAIEVIEHLHNPGFLFNEVSRLLAPNGCFLLTSPNIFSLASRLRFLLTGELKQFGRVGDATHLFPVVPHTLSRMLPTYNLEIVNVWSYPDNGRTLTSRPVINAFTRALRLFLPEPYPGDVLCVIMRKANYR